MGCGASTTAQPTTESSLISNNNNNNNHNTSNHMNGDMMSRNSIMPTDQVSLRRMAGTNTPGSASTDGVANGQTATVVDKHNVLQLFNNLESTIQTMEETKCFEKYRIISDDIEQLKEQLQHLTEKSNELNNRILNATESSKIVGEMTLHDIVVNNLTRRDLTPKDTFWIELLNIQKINELKIDLLQKDIDNFDAEIKELQMLCDQLHELYQQRDNVLNQVFEGNYGSEKEIQLEKELDSLMEERHYIEIAKIRWINSDNLILDGLKCLDNGIDKMRNFHFIPENDYIYRYECMKEARNSLVLAHYNLTSLHNNLQDVQLPHSKIEDLEKLEKDTVKLFNDLSPKGLKEMVDYLEQFRTKTVTQHKWVKEVLNKTIKNDLLNIRDKCRSKSHELRFERAMLFKHKQEQWQQQQQQQDTIQTAAVESIKNDSPFDLRVDSGVDSELDDSVIADEQYTRILASGNHSVTSPNFSNTTPLLPGEELGPMPSNKEIFGKITQIRNKHLREMQEFEQNQLINRTRMSQGLKEKLNVRRTRRNRLDMHKRQMEALQEYPNH